MSALDDWRALYARLGFATIPLRPRTKRPLRRGWLGAREEHWRNVPREANIGVLTGAGSGGLVVLDFDTREGPVDLLGMTPAQLAVLTMVVETSRGWHVYAREAGRATCTLREGVDLRGEGAMVVVPPSVHPLGKVYRFVGASWSIVELAALLPAEENAATQARLEFEEVESWIALQAPKLRDAWRRLKEPPSYSFDASKADFAVARCLWEGGWSVDSVAEVLLRLPGSRARERGEGYARTTAQRAAAVPPKGPRPWPRSEWAS